MEIGCVKTHQRGEASHVTRLQAQHFVVTPRHTECVSRKTLLLPVLFSTVTPQRGGETIMEITTQMHEAKQTSMAFSKLQNWLLDFIKIHLSQLGCESSAHLSSHYSSCSYSKPELIPCLPSYHLNSRLRVNELYSWTRRSLKTTFIKWSKWKALLSLILHYNNIFQSLQVFHENLLYILKKSNF